MDRLFFIAGAALAALGVALGAFGAHSFDPKLTEAGRLETYQTAVRYHLIHAVALLLLAVLIRSGISGPLVQWAGLLHIGGTVLFSGTLYVLALTGIGWLGAVTPLGGLGFVAGWVLLVIRGLQAWP